MSLKIAHCGSVRVVAPHGRPVIVSPLSSRVAAPVGDCGSPRLVVRSGVQTVQYPSLLQQRSGIAAKETAQEPLLSRSLVQRHPLRKLDEVGKAQGDDEGTRRLADTPSVDTLRAVFRESVYGCLQALDKDSDSALSYIEFGKCLQDITADMGIDKFVQDALARYMGSVDCPDKREVRKQEWKKVCQDVLLMACGRYLSSEEQIVVHLKSLFEELDSDDDGRISRQDLVDSALVQRELPFLLDGLRDNDDQQVQIEFEAFREAVMSKATGLVKIRMIREQFEVFARFRGTAPGLTGKLLLSLAEARELVGHQMGLLDSDRVSKALAVMERGRHGGRFGCDDFVWHFADMSHYLEYQLAQIVGLGALKRRLTAFCRGAILDQKRQIVSLREGRKFKPAKARHMIFRGNPGTGKTTIAKIVADIMLKIGLLKHDQFVCVQRESLVGDVIGATAKLTKKKVQEAKGGVLFVDEAYRLFPKDADPKDFGREAVDELMAAMLEDDAPLMIFAGYPKLMDGFLLANPGLRSRIPTTLEFDDYSWSELSIILDQIVAKSGFCFKEGMTLSQVADVLRRVTPPGAADAMNGRMCELIFDGAKRVLDARVSGWTDGDDTRRLFEISIDDLRHGCASVPPPADMHLARRCCDLDRDNNDDDCVDDATESQVWLQQRLSKLVGMEGFKKQIQCFQEGMELDRRRARQGRKVHVNTLPHMIFTGNPGTGKTTVAHVVSELLQRAGILETRKLVEVHRDAFLGQGLVGSAEAATLEIIESARGGVLFVDEANQLQDDNVGQKVIASIMQHMLRPDAPIMIFAGYPEQMAKFEVANKGLASRIPYRFAFPDFDAAALAKIFRTKVDKSGFELAADVEDAAIEEAFDELVPSDVSSRSNGRLCETVFKFAKERLDLACVNEGSISTVITMDQVREGIQKASGWGSGLQGSIP